MNQQRSSNNNPNPNLQFFLNPNDKMIEPNNPDKVYENYVITQNRTLLKENKKLNGDNKDLEQKYVEMEEESGGYDRRLSTTKNYLKNFWFMNDALETTVVEYTKLSKELNIKYLIYEFRLILITFSLFVSLCSVFGFNQWWLLIPLHLGYVYTFHQFFVDQLMKIEQKRKNILLLKKEKDKEIKELKKSMDIISEFIDNAL